MTMSNEVSKTADDNRNRQHDLAKLPAPGDLPAFAKMVSASFQELAKRPDVFVVDVDGDALWTEYLAAFPEGSNPIFRKRTDHDCSTCRQFIRRVGSVVWIEIDGQLRTVWDRAAAEAPGPYRVVAGRLRDVVRAANVSDLFRVSEKEGAFGAAWTRYLDPETKQVITWEHLHTGEIPRALRVVSPDQARGNYRTTVQVFERGLRELSPEAVDTVWSLIDGNSLYRGEEHKAALLAFRAMQQAFLDAPTASTRSLFAWANAGSPAARFRNTVIGTLVQDLSEGQELEHAVRAFETKVAPQNYKRTTALITPGMVKKAMETIAELGLEPALERRFAVIGDVSVNDVKWVDGSVKPLMKGGLGDVLMAHAGAASRGAESDEARAQAIGLDDFMTTVLPGATGLEILFKGEHVGNLMSLTAPVHAAPARLFRWSNDFAWSYRGGVADSFLRKQVQSLGGRVDGVLRFSHMWNHDKRNASLMDLHVFMPGSSPHSDGRHGAYPHGQRVGWNRRSDPTSGGIQDVDYVNPAPEGYIPVENITFPTFAKLDDGQYTFKIHNWQLREPTKGGFRAEIEFAGRVFQYEHPGPLRHKEWVTLATATLKDSAFTIEHHHDVGTPKQELWGIHTEQYVRVNAVMLSPNYWGDNAVGNKHTFFVVDGAKNDETTRGFYNEFLHPRLEPHRTVFEVIGDKTQCQPTEGQLSGLGFSSTKRESFLVRVQHGKKQRVFDVRVGA